MARRLPTLAALVSALALVPASTASAAPTLDLERLTGLEAEKMMQAGQLTSVELTQAYVDRITALNKRGPSLNAVTQFNKEAMNEARASDARRAAGKLLGPADGLPMLMKDLIDVKGMYTSNGNHALRASFPEKDSALVKHLRERGVVILGKLGLSEFANFFGIGQPNGYSNLTGQVLNGLDTDQDVSGSSSGSGSAAAAALSALTIGTETSGSIISPSQANGIVGLRPTVGLVPGVGIGPIAASQDTAGPMDRTVSNAALTLQSIAGSDEEDVEYHRGLWGPGVPDAEIIPPAPAEVPDYLSALSLDYVRGKRIGYNGTLTEGTPLKLAYDALVAAGATLVERPVIAPVNCSTTVTTNCIKPGLSLNYEAKRDIDRYYQHLGPDAPVKSLAEEIAVNQASPQEALKFGNGNHTSSQAIDSSPNSAASVTYRDALLTGKQETHKAIERMMANDDADPADDFIAILGSVSNGPRAGYPQLTIPMGYTATTRRAQNISVNGGAYDEKDLIGVAYVIEQGTKLRQPASAVNPSMYRCADTAVAGSFAARGSCNPDYDEAMKQVGEKPVILPFALETASARSLQGRLEAGTLSSETLTKAYLSRIALSNADGPGTQAVRSLNANAVAQAKALDTERADDGPRGPLHGLPVLLSDQVDAGGLPTTGGSIALQGTTPAADSRLVAKLKAAGAIILGKTNVTELGGLFSSTITEGYSSLGGQVLLPSNTQLPVQGSSAGAAAATASGLAAMTVGMETSTDTAQMIAPSALAGVVALKPTVGRVSRRGVLPVAKSQDSPGPITRTVYDAAQQLQVIAGTDPADTGTTGAPAVPDYTSGLTTKALEGKRVAAITSNASPYPAALEALRVAGATTEVKTPGATPATPSIVGREFKRDLNAYLGATTGTSAKSLADVIAANTANPVEGLKFQQGELETAQAVDLTDPATQATYATDRDTGDALSEAVLDNVLSNGTTSDASDDFEVIAVPNNNALVNVADRAGYPMLTVPAGYTGINSGNSSSRDPQGVTFIAGEFQEAKLLAAGYAFEQATRIRQAPSVTNPSMWRCVPGSAFDNPYNCHPGDRSFTGTFAAAPVTPAVPLPAPAPAPVPPAGGGAAPGTTPPAAGAPAPGGFGRQLPRRFTARVTPGTDTKKAFRFTTRVTLLLPAGFTRATSCSGRVAVRVKAGARTISLRRVFLKRDCTASSTVSFASSARFAGRKKLTVSVRYEGGTRLLPKSAAVATVTVRK